MERGEVVANQGVFRIVDGVHVTEAPVGDLVTILGGTRRPSENGVVEDRAVAPPAKATDGGTKK